MTAKRSKLSHHSIVLGTFDVGINGKYDLGSEKWYFDLHTPISGKPEVRVRAQGIGNNLASINADGKIRFQRLRTEFNQPGFQGQWSKWSSILSSLEDQTYR